MGYCHGTPPWHLTHVYLFPPTQQSETDHEIAAIYGNLRQSAIFCLPVSTVISTISATSVTSAEFYQDYDLKPILPCIHVNWAIKLIIYTLFFCFLISFLYVIFWLYYTVYVHSLIISTLLYIIATCTHFVTLCYVNYLYYYIKYRTNLKPL